MSDDNYDKAKKIIESLQSSLNLVNSNGPSLSYELFIYSLVVEAFANMQGVSSLKVHNPSSNPNLFKPKLKPGKLNTINYSYISFNYNNRIYQIHLDTQYEGHSNSSHEIDISVIEPNFQNQVLYIAVECKNYTTKLPFHLAREFIGALSDFTKQETEIL